MSSSKALAKNDTSGTTRGKNKKLDKIAVHLEYACYLCGNTLSSPRQTINHVRKIHGREIPTRAVGIKRPQSKKYTYVRDKKGQFTIQEQACPSCWFHCPEHDIEALYEHTLEEHVPQKVDPASGVALSEGEDDNEGYVSDISAMSGRSGRSGYSGRSVRSVRSNSVKSTSNGPSKSSIDRSAGDSSSEKAAIPSVKDGRPRRRSVSFEKNDPEELNTGKEIARRLEEVTKLFKSMFGSG